MSPDAQAPVVKSASTTSSQPLSQSKSQTLQSSSNEDFFRTSHQAQNETAKFIQSLCTFPTPKPSPSNSKKKIEQSSSSSKIEKSMSELKIRDGKDKNTKDLFDFPSRLSNASPIKSKSPQFLSTESTTTSTTMTWTATTSIMTTSSIGMTPANAIPILSSSSKVLNREKNKKSTRKSSLPSGGDKLFSFDFHSKRRRAESYRHFLVPRADKKSLKNSQEDFFASSLYDPEFLDDSELRANRHLFGPFGPGNQLPRASELKRELNDQFHAKHPEFESFLKLSHIRSMKAKLLDVALDQNIELSTVAFAYAYFEKIFLKKLIVKANRKMIAGACLLLASKINDPKEIRLSSLLDSLEKRLQVQFEDILKCEFWVFSSLEFTIQLLDSEYLPHLERIFFIVNYSHVKDYLGDKIYSCWKSSTEDDKCVL